MRQPSGRSARGTLAGDPTIKVGEDPEAVAYDPAVGQVFVGNAESGTVSVISDSSNTVVATIPMPAGAEPQGMAYDPAAGEVFVTTCCGANGLGNVTVVSGANDSVVTTFQVGYDPQGIVYDPATSEMFVAMGGGNTVWAISTSNFSQEVKISNVGNAPEALAYDGPLGAVFVAAEGAASGRVAEINTTSDTVTGGLYALPYAASIFYDPGRQQIFVGEGAEGKVQVFGQTGQLLSTTEVVGYPNAFADVPAAGEVIATVGNGLASELVTFLDTDDSVFATVPVPQGPEGIVYDPSQNLLYVSLWAEDDVLAEAPVSVVTVTFSETGLPNGTPWSVVLDGRNVSSTATEIGFVVPNGTYGYDVGFDTWYLATPASGSLVIGSSNVSVPIVFSAKPLVLLTFVETGAPLGAVWNVSVGVPARNFSTVGRSIGLGVSVGTTSFQLTPPAGYGVESVTGKGSLNQTLVNVSGATRVRVQFAPMETLTFRETGLGFGAYWEVFLESALSHGGPNVFPWTAENVGGGCPDEIAYDPAKAELFVTDTCYGEVSVVSDKTLAPVAAVNVSGVPGAILYDPGPGALFVLVGSDVDVISDISDSIVAVVPIGGAPSALALDPSLGEVFVTNNATDNLTVLSDIGDRVVATFPVAGPAQAVDYDAHTGDVYATVGGLGEVVRLAPSNGTVLATAVLGGYPLSLQCVSAHDELFVTNAAGPTVALADTDLAVLANVSVGGLTGPGAQDPAANEVFFWNPVIGFVHFVSETTFQVEGAFLEGWPNLPMGGAYDTALGSLVVTTGGNLSVFSVAKTAMVAEVPADGTLLSFVVVGGPWDFQAELLTPYYRISPAQGVVRVPSHSVTTTVRFKFLSQRITFEETGLPRGAVWGVNVTGQMNLSENTSRHSLSFLLENGSYNYSVWGPNRTFAYPSTGNLSVSAPNRTRTLLIRFTTAAAPAEVRTPLGPSPTAATSAIPLLAGPVAFGRVRSGRTRRRSAGNRGTGRHRYPSRARP